MAKPEHFQALVVGSGFGGSVVGYRLAEAGRKTCILERGKPYPPGSFARTPWEMAQSLHTTNPLESVFAGVRLLTDVAKRACKRENALYLVYKIVKRLSHSWRALNGGPRLMQMVAAIGSESGGDEHLMEPVTGRQFPHLLT